MRKILECSSEFLMARCCNGVQLINPNQIDSPRTMESALLAIAKTGLLCDQVAPDFSASFSPNKSVYGVYLSNRETECLHWLMRGKTAKMIAEKLGISPRTVEDYLNSIKNKFLVTSKAELIEKVISCGYKVPV